MSKSKGRPVSHQPKQPKPPQAPEIANTFQKALALHKQGQLAQAEPLYRAILKQVPAHFDALHLLGVLEAQQKNFAAAVQLIGQALTLNPTSAAAHSNIGSALRDLGRHEEALASFDRAVAIKPDFAEALNNRGDSLRDLRRHEAALASYDQAVAIKPAYAEALNNRGNVLLELSRHEEALASYDRALAIKPDYGDALYNRGNALRTLKRHEEAAEEFEKLLHLKPDYDGVGGDRFFSQLHCCAWQSYHQNVALLVDEVIAGKYATAPFPFLAVSDSPNARLRCARTFSAHKYPGRGQPI